jgi:hypothetical protein
MFSFFLTWVLCTFLFFATDIDILLRLIGFSNTDGVGPALLGGLMAAIATVVFFHIAELLAVSFRRSKYIKLHKIFVDKVNQLDDLQAKMLLNEYSNRERIEIIYYKKTMTTGSASVYKTKNFLFIPGLFLIRRDEIVEIRVVDAAVGTSPFGDKDTRIMFRLKRGEPTHLPLDYSYDESPKTLEQIMAWFWQCDPNDLTLPNRVKGIVKRVVREGVRGSKERPMR